MSGQKLLLNLYWHMHQPDYRDLTSGEYILPWTYLHALKDYSDMAYHLELNPAARVSFNFVPILVEQLQDYAGQARHGDWRDPLLRLLSKPDLERITDAECQLIVDSCFKAHHEKMLSPFPHYQRLLHLYELIEPLMQSGQFHYLSAQYKADLLVWYHLAWTGESLRRKNKVIQDLMQKGLFFTLEDRQALLDVISETLQGILPRYKALLEKGQIELSTTPYYHPILPLLIDLQSAHDAMPDAPLPQSATYPDGHTRAIAHVEAAKTFHEKVFGQAATGMWPAEGAVSHAALSLLAEQNVAWAATGQAVLANSLSKLGLAHEHPQQYLYQPYRVTNGQQDIVCFFRDDQLSDKIGFEYARQYASEAVHDFIQSLEAILASSGDETPVVSVILDGENAWEYYPYNGYYFLQELYQALAQHPSIEMTTFSDILGMQQAQTLPQPALLNDICAGSWVYGTFSTWIGETAKNRAWDLLCAAKQQYDQYIHQLPAAAKDKCQQQLSICEGSDWFWWFGDYNDTFTVQSFDQLYRRNLSNLYQLLGLVPPESLSRPVSTGGGQAENAGTMRRGQS
ncbi:Alpha-amylase/alpha-mannosidase, GH57 family [Methylophilus rhizosphaerae]|uniref:Alpha-amylase/alpha-mannosidase, GH57 family n=1 Tax=Methylophilus rhizosphaerae TaxID=492660 RepID=A0A1G9B0C6_9PROT|nr:glycoside hydrolase family 57 protein [Methylophilus rhizosphaerae]SDK32430.1 Alpha-amylase/alpha-mannosidase, GH57 family [Methylophilus rhizosphaerae]